MAKEDDSVTLIKVIDTVARAKGMTKIAKEAGISREGLYKSLSPNDNPSFAIICKILNAIGYTLVPTRIAKKTECFHPPLKGNLSTKNRAGCPTGIGQPIRKNWSVAA